MNVITEIITMIHQIYIPPLLKVGLPSLKTVEFRYLTNNWNCAITLARSVLAFTIKVQVFSSAQLNHNSIFSIEVANRFSRPRAGPAIFKSQGIIAKRPIPSFVVRQKEITIGNHACFKCQDARIFRTPVSFITRRWEKSMGKYSRRQRFHFVQLNIYLVVCDRF